MKLTFNTPQDIFFIGWIGTFVLVVGLFIQIVFQQQEVNPFFWLLLVLGFDVTHVYSTLYRTYLKSDVAKPLKVLLRIIPVFSFFSVLILATFDVQLFWRCLAYMAVFHFTRQQIGFYQITTSTTTNTWVHRLNRFSLYLWTLGSILLWHLKGPQQFDWFVKDDFFYLNDFEMYELILTKTLLVLFLASFILNVIFFINKKITLLQLGLLISTFLTWFVPIAYLTSDFLFTWTNVLAHGIPYMYLIHKNESQSHSRFSRWDVFVLIILACSLFEEALWDALVWREHSVFFSSFYFLPQVNSQVALSVALALLVTPQLTHYLLDGFIWKKKYWL